MPPRRRSEDVLISRWFIERLSPVGFLFFNVALLHLNAGGLTLPHPTANASAAKPDDGSLALTEAIMRVRAYRFFEARGYEHGHDLEDWLRAEAEIVGKKPAPAAEAEDMEGRSTAA